jgi:hypothetical protein
VNKNIRTIISANKTISLRVIKPFHLANHYLLLVDPKQNPPEAESMENETRAFGVGPHAENDWRSVALSDKSIVKF